MEVDAVVERLSDALAAAQDRITLLEQRLEDSDVSSAAITRTLAAVERTKQEILEEANAEADRVRGDATSEAEAIMALASALGIEIAERRGQLFSEACSQSDEILSKAHREASEQQVRAAEMAADLIADATRKAAEIEDEAATSARNQHLAAAWALRATADKADKLVMDAERKAALIVRDAEFESERLSAKSENIRQALTALKSAAQALADNTVSEAEVIDLAALETDQHPSANPAISLVEVDEPDAPVDQDQSSTFYQRRTATLRERIEMAKLMP